MNMSESANLEKFLEKYNLEKYYDKFLGLKITELEFAINLSDTDLDYIFTLQNEIYDKTVFRMGALEYKKELVCKPTLFYLSFSYKILKYLRLRVRLNLLEILKKGRQLTKY